MYVKVKPLFTLINLIIYFHTPQGFLIPSQYIKPNSINVLKIVSKSPIFISLQRKALLSSPSHHKLIMTSSNIAFPSNGDDYIGTESCIIDLQNENDAVGYTSKSNDFGNQAKAKSSIKKKEKKRVFPPPIPFLAQTQNQWVLKRYYTSEGRLILKEEKVKHQEYFLAHRANGRLTLQLVPFDEDYFFGTSEVEASPTSPHEEINNVAHDKSIVITNRLTDEENKVSIVADGLIPVENDNGVVAGANGRLKCLNCNSLRSTPSCIFGVPVHPIRTVRG